ncbi:hypothetical protein GEMRC1_008250 [Eukaryota sp. GEM-RC1]
MSLFHRFCSTLLLCLLVCGVWGQFKCPSELPVFCSDLKRCLPTSESCELAKRPDSDAEYYCFHQDKFVHTPRDCCGELDNPYAIAPCPDGSCALLEDQCVPLSCPSTHPVQCPHNGLCAECLEHCPKPTCSSSKPFLCPDLSCVSDYWDCLCPEDASFRCPNTTTFFGTDYTTMTVECRVDVEVCPHQRTFCDQWRPIRCDDGKCVLNRDDCKEVSDCPHGTSRCESNGFCLEDLSKCPLPNGCPSSKPILCETGICVSEPSFCPNPYRCLDSRAPIKCPGGFCVADSSYCPPLTDEYPHPTCHSLLPFLCENGKCAENPLLCPAIDPCPCDFPERWNDHVCREEPFDNSTSPTSRCPPGYYWCSSSGRCVDDYSKCYYSPNPSSCPPDMVKCPGGSCVSSLDQCVSNTRLCNGCSVDKPRRCADGICVADEGECVMSNGCMAETPIKCVDGQCVADATDCPRGDFVCTSDQIKCSYGCASKHDGCSKGLVCTHASLPFLCMNGNCVAESNDCPLHIVCNNKESTLCDDYSVLIDDECRPINPCDGVICPNGRCVSNADQCGSFSCPSHSPILCHRHLCVSSLSDCYRNGGHWSRGGGSGGYRYSHGRRAGRSGSGGFVEYGENGWIENIAYDNVSDPIKIDGFGPGWGGRFDGGYGMCRGETPFNCNDGSCAKDIVDCWSTVDCSEGHIRCSDGACRRSIEECSTLQPCPFNRNKRCSDGTCVPMDAPCASSSTECDEEEELCSDGQCKESCEELNGCDLNAPVFCGNGECSWSQEGCIKGCYQNHTTQFQCFDGECVDDFMDCHTVAPYTVKGLCVTYSRDEKKTLEADITSEYDEEVLLGRLVVGTSLFVSSFLEPLPISVCTPPDSEIRAGIISTDLIRSPVIEVKVAEGQPRNNRFGSFELSMTLPNGLVHNVDDYCLATLNGTSSPYCIDDDVTFDSSSDMLKGKANSEGMFFFSLKEDLDEVCPGHLPYKCKSSDSCAVRPSQCPAVSSGFSLVRFSWTFIVLFVCFLVKLL